MDLISIIMLSIGTVLSIIFIIILLLSSKKYSVYIESLPNDKHFFKPIYPVGFFVLEKIKYSYLNKLDKKRLEQCKVIYGDKYGEYYFRLNCAQKVSVGLFVVPLIFLFYSLFNSSLIFILGIVFVLCEFWYYDMQITDVIEKRNKEIERELPNILSKLTLLVNAGMILAEAWVKVSSTGTTTIYQEMNNAILEMQNGTSEVDAYLRFSDKCMNIEVKKFISTLVQNVTKGNKELVDYLKKQTALSWEEKKHSVRRRGEKASSKLLIPIGIMFMGILIMIIVPVFSNMAF